MLSSVCGVVRASVSFVEPFSYYYQVPLNVRFLQERLIALRSGHDVSPPPVDFLVSAARHIFSVVLSPSFEAAIFELSARLEQELERVGYRQRALPLRHTDHQRQLGRVHPERPYLVYLCRFCF